MLLLKETNETLSLTTIFTGTSKHNSNHSDLHFHKLTINTLKVAMFLKDMGATQLDILRILGIMTANSVLSSSYRKKNVIRQVALQLLRLSTSSPSSSLPLSPHFFLSFSVIFTYITVIIGKKMPLLNPLQHMFFFIVVIFIHSFKC